MRGLMFWGKDLGGLRRFGFTAMKPVLCTESCF